MSEDKSHPLFKQLSTKAPGFYARYPVGTVLWHSTRNNQRIRTVVVTGRRRRTTVLYDAKGEVCGLTPRPQGRSFYVYLGNPPVKCWYPLMRSAKH